jgi:hypothetical protein
VVAARFTASTAISNAQVTRRSSTGAEDLQRRRRTLRRKAQLRSSSLHTPVGSRYSEGGDGYPARGAKEVTGLAGIADFGGQKCGLSQLGQLLTRRIAQLTVTPRACAVLRGSWHPRYGRVRGHSVAYVQVPAFLCQIWGGLAPAQSSQPHHYLAQAIQVDVQFAAESVHPTSSKHRIQHGEPGWVGEVSHVLREIATQTIYYRLSPLPTFFVFDEVLVLCECHAVLNVASEFQARCNETGECALVGSILPVAGPEEDEKENPERCHDFADHRNPVILNESLPRQS